MKQIQTKDKYLRRILRLADFMETVPRRRFNFRYWVGDSWEGAADFSCGTSACAIGWATTMPYFRKLGLRMLRQGIPSMEGGIYLDIRYFDIRSLFADLRSLFGLDVAEFQRLFVPCLCGLAADATPKQWARFAREFVAKKIANG